MDLRPTSGSRCRYSYSVYLTLGEKEGLLGTTNGTSLAVKKGDLNGVVINSLGVTKNDKAEGVTAYVSAQIASAAYAEVVKSPLSNPFSVQTYAAPLKWLFLCGRVQQVDHRPGIPVLGDRWRNQYLRVHGRPLHPLGLHAYRWRKLLLQGDGGPVVVRCHWGYSALQSNWTNVENNDNNLNLPITETNIYALSVNTVAMSITQTPIGKTLGLAGRLLGLGRRCRCTSGYDWTDNTWKTAPLELEGGKELKVRADGAGLPTGARRLDQ